MSNGSDFSFDDYCPVVAAGELRECEALGDKAEPQVGKPEYSRCFFLLLSRFCAFVGVDPDQARACTSSEGLEIIQRYCSRSSLVH